MFFKGRHRPKRSQNYLIHLLIRDWKFRLALGFMLLITFGVSLMLPKVWTVSPEGYSPVSKVSGLDFIQAWSLQRQALKLESENQLEQAAASWNACIANRPFHSPALRKALKTFAQLPDPDWRQVLQVRYYGQMLEALNPQKIDDHVLVADTLFKMGALTEAVAINKHFDLVTKDEQSLFLFSALFFLNDLDIPEVWLEQIQSHPDEGSLFAESILKVSRLVQNRDRYDELVLFENEGTETDSSGLEQHLEFQLAFKMEDLENLNESFIQLHSRGMARSWHLLKKWRLQLKSGESTRVWSEIRHEKNLRLLNADQVLELAGIYLDLNKITACQQMLESWLEVFPSASSLWVLQGELLMKSQDRDHVRALAGRIRSEPSLGVLLGYSWFLEGEGFRRGGEKERSDLALKKWEESRVHLPSLDLRMTRHMRDVGLADLALRRFKSLEPHFQDHPEFWQELFEFAHQEGQIQYLLRAARRLHELDSRSPQHANNHAAVLLALRENASQAVAITMSLVQQFPSDLMSRINHIHALIQNKRLEDAEALLLSIDRAYLPEDFVPAFDLAVFELACLQGNLEQAQAVLKYLKIEKLLPPQKIWVMDTSNRLGLELFRG